MAETVAVVGAESGDVKAGGEREHANGAVSEAGGEVVVGECETAARSAVRVNEVVRVEVEGVVRVSSGAEVGGGAVAEDELVAPGRVEEVGPAPDLAGEAEP